MKVSRFVLFGVIAACGKGANTPPTPAPATPAPAPATSVTPAPATPAPATLATPAPATLATPTPATPTTAAQPDDKTLERTPGLTDALPLVVVDGPAGKSPAMGPSDAKVKVIVYSDFQCPVCRRAVEPLKRLVRDLAPDVQVIWRNNALAMHQRAEPAARAAMAAMRQGKFWELHDRLFEGQADLSDEALRQRAVDVGLDMTQFDKDLVDPALAAQIAAEAREAEALDARGTPAFFVNGDKTVGWGSMAGLRHQIERARTAAGALTAEEATRAKDPAVADVLFGKAK